MKLKLIIDKEKDEEVVITAHQRTALVEEIEALISKHTDRIPGYAEDDIKMLSVSEIECVTVLNGKTYAIDSKNVRYRLKQRLYELEQQLPPSFFRINKSTLANEAHLDRFAVTYAGSVDAVFKCGYTEYVSRRCFAQIKRRLEGK
jgi:DNA-binding LytR/AlgR family response regulator